MEVGAEAGQRPGRDARGMSTLNLDDESALDLAFGAFPAHESVELAAREVDGISIALYWLRGSDVLAVTVDDATTGDRFELVVAEKERPLDVFYHPFAYAHARGIELFGDRHLAGVAVDV
jgi:hypothetical protein